MTANNNFLLRYVLPSALIAPFALSGCSSQSIPSTPSGPHPGLAVFNQAINQSAIPDTIVREGDAVSYVVQSSIEPPMLTRFDISCNGNSGSMFYQTRNGMAPFSESKTSTDLPQIQFELLQQSDQFKAVCEQRAAPDWRVLNAAEGQDWLLLDRNSAQIEDGVLKVWTGKHFVHQQFDGANRHFVSQVRERLALKCDLRTFKVSSHFKLDAEAKVLNGWVRSENELRPVQDAPLVQQQLFNVICKGQEAWFALPPLRPRNSLPPRLSTPQVAPQVLAAIEALGLPAPRLSLKQVNYRYDAVLFNGIRFNDRSKQDFISVDEESGQMLVQPIDSATAPQLRLTFRGLFELARRSIDEKTGKEVSDLSKVTGLRFIGNWQDLPTNSEVSYTLTRARDTEAGSKSHDNTVTCKIGNEIPASSYNSALLGMAKPLKCIKMKTSRVEWSERLTYLSDYGMFVQTSEDGVVGKWIWRIDSVE